jgi:predicted permease
MRLDVLEVLNDRTTEGRRRRRMGLLPVQVALSLVALMDAGLLLRSVRAGVDTNIGFDHRGVVAATIAYQPFGKYAESVQQYQAIIDELTQTQGVTSAAAATHVPLASYPVRPFAVGPYVEGAAASAAHTVVTGVSHVSNGYFDVLGVPLLEGRRFAAQDVAGATRVIILNASAAKALYPAESAIGKLVHAPWFGPLQFSYTVVGIVADTKYGALQDASIPFAFIPLAQEEAAGMSVTILARTRSPAAAFETIHRAIRQAAPDRKLASAGSATLPGAPIRLLTDQVVRLLAPQRFAALLLTCFGALSLCVSAVGIYGNVAYAVSRRTAEIGVRMALGARIVDVLWIVSRDVALAFAAGAAIGVVGCVVTSGLVARLLYDVAPTDPVAFLVALGLAAFTAIMAAVVPAWQAVRIDPARAIRGSG